jgi:hypothetical protein
MNFETTEKLISYAYVHLIISIIILLLIVAYYAKGIGRTNKNYEYLFERKIRLFKIYIYFIRAAARVLNIYWLYLLLICVLMILLSSLKDYLGILLNSMLVIIAILSVFEKNNQGITSLAFLSIITLFCTVSLFFVLNIISADIEVETNKCYFDENEMVELRVESKGYIIKPQIEKIIFDEENDIRIKEGINIIPSNKFTKQYYIISFKLPYLPYILEKRNSILINYQ